MNLGDKIDKAADSVKIKMEVAKDPFDEFADKILGNIKALYSVVGIGKNIVKLSVDKCVQSVEKAIEDERTRRKESN